jgi:hypothetical protein
MNNLPVEQLWTQSHTNQANIQLQNMVRQFSSLIDITLGIEYRKSAYVKGKN